jgi:glycosyltransferase involved in cell wall biosynthesis
LTDVSIIMPVFNERATVVRAVDEILATSFPVDDYELLVVDDGSTDGTAEVLSESPWPDHVRVLSHERNRGKGAAFQTALAQAQGTWTVTMDADLEYAAADLPRLLEPLIDGGFDATIGARTFGAHTAYSFWFVIAGKALTVFANMLYNSWITDMLAAQKAMRTEMFRSLPLREPGFGLETEIVAQLVLRRARIKEVPVDYEARTREQGKKLTALDGLRVLRTLIRCRFASGR